MKGAKKKAWDWFSKYIRLRDCITTTGSSDWFICPTCHKKLPATEAQAGHAIGGRGNSILLHEDIVHAQCRGDNITGKYAEYSVFMIKEYELEAWEGFIALSKQPCTIKEFEWLEKADYYREKYNGLRSLGL